MRVGLLVVVVAALSPGAWAAEPLALSPADWSGGQWVDSGIAPEPSGDALRLSYEVGETADAWPHVDIRFPETVDLGNRTALRFRIRAEAARPLPRRFLSLLVEDEWGARAQVDQLPTELVGAASSEQTVNLEALPQPLLEHARAVQFFVWNRDYHNAGFAPGERVVFEITDLTLIGDRASSLVSRLDAPPLSSLLARDPRADVWTEPLDEKILPERELPERLAEAGVVSLEAARNEYVDFQVAIRAKGDPLTGLRVVVEPPAGVDGVRVRPEGLIRTTQKTGSYIRPGLIPDPLLEEETLDVPAGETRAVHVRLHVPEGAAAGDAQGTVRVEEGGAVLATGSVRLHVWEVTLPRVPRLPTCFQLSMDHEWSKFLTYYPDADDALFRALWRSFGEHRVSPMYPGREGPPRPDDEAGMARWDAELDYAKELGFAHMPAFHFDAPVATEEDRAWVRRITDHWVARGMLDRTYVYMCQFDEAGPARWPAIREYAAALKETEPRLNRMLTVAPVEGLYGAIDTWCPITHHYNRELARERRAQREKVWWYTCVGFTPGYLIDQPGVEHRALAWLTRTHEADGLLFWCVNFWRQNPWEQPLMGEGTWGNGDGYLLYPRKPEDPPGRFYESLRWETMRDGLEDYDYLALLDDAIARGGEAEALVEAREARAVADRIAGDLRDFSRSPEDYAEARRRIARALERLGT